MKGSECSRPNSTCLVLPPGRNVCSLASLGMCFHWHTPYPPGSWAGICVRASHLQGLSSSSQLTALAEFQKSSLQLSVHLLAWHTQEALIKTSVLGSQSKGQVDGGTEFLFKSLSSRTCPPTSSQVPLAFQRRGRQP